MSRPKHDWYYHAVRQIRKYPDELAREGTLQANVWKGAVERTLEHTRKMPDGDLRVKAVELRFFDRRYTDRKSVV